MIYRQQIRPCGFCWQQCTGPEQQTEPRGRLRL